MLHLESILKDITKDLSIISLEEELRIRIFGNENYSEGGYSSGFNQDEGDQAEQLEYNDYEYAKESKVKHTESEEPDERNEE